MDRNKISLILSDMVIPKLIKVTEPNFLSYLLNLSMFVCSSYKTMTGSSSYRFGVLARIVRHMRSRHQEGDDHPLTIDEVLDETNQLDVGNKVKQVSFVILYKEFQ